MTEAAPKDGRALDERTAPPVRWWAPRAVLALVIIVAFSLSGWKATPFGGLVAPACGVAGSLYMLMGAWWSIRVREELTRLSLIHVDDALVREEVARLTRDKNEKMVALLRLEWRCYIDGVLLLCVSFGIDLAAQLRVWIAGLMGA